MRRLWGWVAHNGQLKLAALALAVVLWTAARVDSPVRQTVTNVPVVVELDDDQWALSGTARPATVEVRVNGTTRDLLRLANDRPQVVVPIQDVRAGDSSLVIRREWVRFIEGAGIQVEDIQPSSVHLTFERMRTTTLPFTVHSRGEPAGGLAVASVLRPSPLEGAVTGPPARLEELSDIPLEQLDLARIDAPGVYAVRIDTSRLDGLRVDPEVVEISVRLDSAVQRVFTDVPVRIEGDGQGMVADPDVVTVSVWGARSVLATVNPSDIRAIARVELVDSLSNDGELRFPLILEGLPQPSRAETATDSIRVRLPAT